MYVHGIHFGMLNRHNNDYLAEHTRKRRHKCMHPYYGSGIRRVCGGGDTNTLDFDFERRLYRNMDDGNELFMHLFALQFRSQ
jgi:hypothetical protein